MPENTIIITSHTPYHKQSWNIDNVDPKQRLVYLENIVAWGEGENLKYPTIDLRDIIENYFWIRWIHKNMVEECLIF